jgi:RNA polymerase sigma-70 factor (ECF subfamily)
VKELILNEEELARRCSKNDRHAQEFLFNHHYQDLYLISMRYLSDHHNAEDVIIQSFTKVFKSIKRFKYQGQGSLGRWIRTILINEAIRFLQKKNLIKFNADLKYLENQDAEANGLQQMQASDIMRLIEQLPTGYRTVFNLFVIEGYAHREIAEMLNISENTSKSQLKKARSQLMLCINEETNYGTSRS